MGLRETYSVVRQNLFFEYFLALLTQAVRTFFFERTS